MSSNGMQGPLSTGEGETGETAVDERRRRRSRTHSDKGERDQQVLFHHHTERLIDHHQHARLDQTATAKLSNAATVAEILSSSSSNTTVSATGGGSRKAGPASPRPSSGRIDRRSLTSLVAPIELASSPSSPSSTSPAAGRRQSGVVSVGGRGNSPQSSPGGDVAPPAGSTDGGSGRAQRKSLGLSTEGVKRKSQRLLRTIHSEEIATLFTNSPRGADGGVTESNSHNNNNKR